MARVNVIACLGFLTVAMVSRSALAATCTVTGTTDIQSWDSYYCDTSVLDPSDCYGWAEVNLDVGTKPMKYMFVHVEDLNGNILGGSSNYRRTNEFGVYSISWTQSSCAGQKFKVRHKYKRFDANDTGTPPVWAHFRLVPDSLVSTWSTITPQYQFSGSGQYGRYGSASTCTVDKHFLRTSALRDKLASVYYAASSAIAHGHDRRRRGPTMGARRRGGGRRVARRLLPTM